MSARTQLRDTVQIRGRFHRSVQLSQDWSERGSLDGYLLTPTVRELSTRLLGSLAPGIGGTRAWSVTGPYGSGKSAFALFLTDLLSGDPSAHSAAHSLREANEFSNSPFVPVLVVGQRAPLKTTLLGTLADATAPFDEALSEEIASVDGAQISDEDVVRFYERVATAAESHGRGGLLVVLDEFGKFLEYAALHPESEDLFVMQGLAEAAARSTVPMLIVTMLHSAFADYLGASAGDARRAEWQKVQGRFVDVAFQEPPEQLLQLVATAIEFETPEIKDAYERQIDRALSSPALDECRSRLPLEELLPSCAPLDPVTSLLLWPLFRSKLAQNERSLFAFLTGYDSSAFVGFLASETFSADLSELPLYRVDRLYDYVTDALGAGTYRGDLGRRWVEIDHALMRIGGDAPELTSSVIKAIGLLGAYGRAVGLRASRDALSLSLGDPAGLSDALAYLERSSIVVYRRHEGAYGLWEGSDVDLDAAFEEGLEQTGRGHLADRLRQMVALRPVVARGHYVRSGTMRYFEVGIIDGTTDALSADIGNDLDSPDGRITYVLASEDERPRLIDYARKLTSDPEGAKRLRIFTFPEPVAGLEEALREAEAWKWVQENVTALEGDPVARRELNARLIYAQNRLEGIAGKVLGLRGHRFDPTTAQWIQAGEAHTPVTSREFLEWLSLLCDEVYHHAPVFKNELLNRDHLSSAAAAARKSLISRMLTRESENRLGIIGTPPEVSMYESLLASGGFHRLRKGEWRFGVPAKEWNYFWSATNDFLSATETGRRPLTDLYEVWTQPPLGFKNGPLPVLFCLVALASREDVAIYDSGLYAPELRIELFERLLRSPEAFEIQRFVINDAGREALEALGNVVGVASVPAAGSLESSRLLEVVKPMIIAAAKLPTYAKYTKHTEPPQASEVRNSLLQASDPYALLFDELPEILGISLEASEDAADYAKLLHECLIGLQRAYPRLLDRIEEQSREVFDLHGSSEEARAQLQVRAEPLIGSAADKKLSLFVREASRRDERDWREVIARVVNDGTPPSAWRDPDAVNFQLRLREIASDFFRLEELVAEKRRTGTEQILRIGILNGQVREARELVALTPKREAAASSLTKRIADLLLSETVDDEEGRKTRLAALTRAAMLDLRHAEEKSGD